MLASQRARYPPYLSRRAFQPLASLLATAQSRCSGAEAPQPATSWNGRFSRSQAASGAAAVLQTCNHNVLICENFPGTPIRAHIGHDQALGAGPTVPRRALMIYCACARTYRCKHLRWMRPTGVELPLSGTDPLSVSLTYPAGYAVPARGPSALQAWHSPCCHATCRCPAVWLLAASGWSLLLLSPLLSVVANPQILGGKDVRPARRLAVRCPGRRPDWRQAASRWPGSGTGPMWPGSAGVRRRWKAAA